MALDGDVITFKNIQYFPRKCIINLNEYQVYNGLMWDEDEDDEKIPCSIIRIVETNGDENMEDEEAYIKRNFDQICCREKEARKKIRSEPLHPNLHNCHLIRVDKDKRVLYIAAEPIVCNLFRLIQLPKEEQRPADYPVRHVRELIKYNGREGSSFTVSKKELVRQIARGVAYFHSHDRLHRNLTPDNIFISLDRNSNVIVKISAFYLSKKTREDSTASFSGTRTRDWSPREMLKEGTERVGREVDIFSLGCLFHYIFTGGKHPFDFKEKNIKSDKFRPKEVTDKPSHESVLFTRMISHNPQSRPGIEEVEMNPALRDDPYYLLYCHDNGKTKPGLCAIFNQMEFRKASGDSQALEDRPWSKHDETKLKETFGRFGFEVEIFRNKTTGEIREEMEKLRSRTGYQSIVLCFLSHGNETGIFGVDLRVVSYDELRNYFASSSELEMEVKNGRENLWRNLNPFHQKPKIFLYQACRGTESQLKLVETNRQDVGAEQYPAPGHGQSGAIGQTLGSLDPNRQGVKAEQYPAPDYGLSAEVIQKLGSRIDPALSDYLEVHSTIPGYQSYLDSGGSVFIQKLCDELMKEAGKKDFSTVAESLNATLQPEMTAKRTFHQQVILVESSMKMRLQLVEQVCRRQEAQTLP